LVKQKERKQNVKRKNLFSAFIVSVMTIVLVVGCSKRMPFEPEENKNPDNPVVVSNNGDLSVKTVDGSNNDLPLDGVAVYKKNWDGSLEAWPQGRNITADGGTIGFNAIVVGNHVFVGKKDGYTDGTSPIDIKPNSSETVFLVLHKVVTYHLTVNSGYGDGDYVAGTKVKIYADAALPGQHFAGWTGDVSYVVDPANPETEVTMPVPGKNITETATYTQDAVIAPWFVVKRNYTQNTFEVSGEWFSQLLSQGVKIEIKLNGTIDPIATYTMTSASKTVSGGTYTRITFVYTYPDHRVVWHYHGMVGHFDSWQLVGVKPEGATLPQDCPPGTDQWLKDS
jgi:hypothetical protein